MLTSMLPSHVDDKCRTLTPARQHGLSLLENAPLSRFPGPCKLRVEIEAHPARSELLEAPGKGGWPRGERKEMKGERPREGGCLRGCHFHKPVTNKANYLSDPYKPGGSGKCP